MPNLADLVIKKNDGTTNVTWTGVQRSAGDLSPARWEEQALTTMRAGRPTFTMKAGFSGNARDARKTETRGVYPYLITDSTTGTQRILANIVFEGKLWVPSVVPVAYADEAVAQLLNLIAGSKSGWQGGYSYT